jgi:predicted AAA+ superfamily ATPase
MKRKIFKDFQKWSDSSTRKPLVLKGARQVGKTHILEEFGRESFEAKGYQAFYVDFRLDQDVRQIFTDSQEPDEILKALEYRFKTKIDEHHDLLILDEVQDCPGAISSMKYFEQGKKHMRVICAGSHLGMLNCQNSFPVGKVDFLYMFPMSYEEFLMEWHEELYVQWRESLKTLKPLSSFFHEECMKAFFDYLFTGGLPEVVSHFMSYREKGEEESLCCINEVRDLQGALWEGYAADFAKYSDVVNANHILHVFDSIPMQLQNVHDDSVKRYQFSNVIPKRKGFTSVRGPLDWLKRSRLCISSFISEEGKQPLLGYCKENRFKVYGFDVGLLNYKLGTTFESIHQVNETSYKGFVAENFVAQELYTVFNSDLFSWQKSTAEIEFLFPFKEHVFPLEVKSSKRSRRSKSLESYMKRYTPPYVIKVSGENLKINSDKKTLTVPIYFSSQISRVLEALL